MKKTNKIYEIYKLLYKSYGPQGWWPFVNYDGANESKNGNTEGYHILDYTFPRDIYEIFEVCLGSILTQNTSFTSVVKSLHNLKNLNALTPSTIKKLDIDDLKLAIKPSGYHNQKAKYILEFISFFESLEARTPTRDELLSVLGVGQETADSILLYGYNVPEFKIDAYTKRVLLELGLIDEKAKYQDMKQLMQEALTECIEDEKERVIVFQEYHALIVNHSKEFYSKKPYGVGCFLKEKII
ncbi:endonuclease III domain-containing protein [Sulfurimonas sp.]|uniref:endonuclease III domain-containing protein n=1 Tax=Sulfurimonas sp. TaxID=2022749 RepID=UPI0035629149